MTALRVELTALDGPAAGSVWSIPRGAPRRFGGGPDADVPVRDPSIEPVHFAVYWFDAMPRARDLGSHGGTFRNERALRDEPIAHGDQLRAGGVRFAVAVITDDATDVAATRVTPTARRVATLSQYQGRVYAVLDAARDDEVVRLLRRSGAAYRSLYDGWAAEVFDTVSPYLVQLRRRGPLMERVLEQGWGRAWGIFVLSRAPFADVRRQLRRWLKVDVEGLGVSTFRFYDPDVMRNFAPTCTPAQIEKFLGCIDAVVMEAVDLPPWDPTSHVPMVVLDRRAPDRLFTLDPRPTG